MKKEVSPVAFVAAIVVVLAVIGWFVWKSNLIGTPLEEHPHNGGPGGEVRQMLQQRQNSPGQPR